MVQLNNHVLWSQQYLGSHPGSATKAVVSWAVCIILPQPPFPCLQMVLMVFPIQIARCMELGMCSIQRRLQT